MSRRRGDAAPDDHCAVNVALYGAQGHRWAMTERGAASLSRSNSDIAIGPSSMSWDGTALTIELNEIANPVPRRIQGRVRLIPDAVHNDDYNLTPDGRHRWRPLAPNARIDVEMLQPGMAWTGDGYWDCNVGCEPIETAFRSWQWSRAAGLKDTTIHYDTDPRSGAAAGLSLSFQKDGVVQTIEAPPAYRLPRTGWRIERQARSERPIAGRDVKTLEDTPFYARSAVRTSLGGEDRIAMHESLSLDRFRSAVVQLMLPFRMPRRRG